MISDEEFRELQKQFFDNGTVYSESSPHYEQAKLILKAIEKIESINLKLNKKYEDERHWYQQNFIMKGTNGILSTHFLTKNNFYDSAYRDVRTVLETFLVLNYMNENKIETAIKFLRQEREIIDSDLTPDSEKWSWERIYTEQEFHDMLADEKSRLREKSEDIGRIFDFLSNRNVHPTRVHSTYHKREYHQKEEDQLIKWQLDLVLGLIVQTLKLYSDTSDYLYVTDELTEIGRAIEEDHSIQPFVEMAFENFPK
jgi:hypothetical protein